MSTNRTVYTFVGAPDDVIEGALAAARVAHKHIDMRTQKGEHPRIGLWNYFIVVLILLLLLLKIFTEMIYLGAMDVCPFIPVRNIT